MYGGDWIFAGELPTAGFYFSTEGVLFCQLDGGLAGGGVTLGRFKRCWVRVSTGQSPEACVTGGFAPFQTVEGRSLGAKTNHDMRESRLVTHTLRRTCCIPTPS